MKTHVMKRSPAEKDAAVEGNYALPAPSAPDYPYGLRLTLDDECLKKLGINRLPKPGDKFRVEGEAHVTSAEQRDTDQNSDRRVELVLHELGFEPKRGNSTEKPERSIREDLEDARHQAPGSTARRGRIGARVAG